MKRKWILFFVCTFDPYFQTQLHWNNLCVCTMKNYTYIKLTLIYIGNLRKATFTFWEFQLLTGEMLHIFCGSHMIFLYLAKLNTPCVDLFCLVIIFFLNCICVKNKTIYFCLSKKKEAKW